MTLLLNFLKIVLNIILSYFYLIVFILHILFSLCDAFLYEIAKFLQKVLFEIYFQI
jgi:hypothetical protein